MCRAGRRRRRRGCRCRRKRQRRAGKPATCYPTLCLPGSPDLDCADIPQRNFPVKPPDPHRLDGDGDGVGCER
ncbi:MAG: excalibur calcium-binding domain-containing protein [Chloroflexia bacterium]